MLERPNTDLEKELRQLVMDARTGNKQSYAELLNRLTPTLKRAAVGQLARFGKADYAEDALQETLLAIHLKLHTYDLKQPFLAWVRAVMKHKIIDYLRRQKVKHISLDDDSFWEPADENNPEIQSVVHDLQKLLNTLKPPAGKIIYDMKVDGASVSELSMRYNMSEANIKVIVHRGLKKLSDQMRKERAA